MSQAERLDRDLTAWFAETAAPSVPDWTDEILRATAGSRQRPRWSFPSRWIPMADAAMRRATPVPTQLRAVVLLGLLLLALAAALLIVGSRPRIPPPFGLAANGVVVYSNDGDIYTVDPGSGERRRIVGGTEEDVDPRFSLDGARIVFFRAVGTRWVPVFARADGTDLVVGRDSVSQLSSDSIAWSPASDAVAFWASGAIHVAEAADGSVTALDLPMSSGEAFWRPGHGRQLLYLTETDDAERLVLLDLVTGEEVGLPLPDDIVGYNRASGWTPDGQTFAFFGTTKRAGTGTYLVDIETGTWRLVQVAYGQLSNDGTRIVGLASDHVMTWPCVVSLTGGGCTPIAEPVPDPWGTYFRWSPSDDWILAIREDGARLALDPDGILAEQPAWALEGVESWQRTARFRP